VHQYDWDITPGDEVEVVRPQFEIEIHYRKTNPVTQVLALCTPGFNITRVSLTRRARWAVIRVHNDTFHSA